MKNNRGALFNRAAPWSNVHVAEGANLQAQIDAAAAVYTATLLDQVVIAAEVSDRSYTAANGVMVLFLEDMIARYDDYRVRAPILVPAPAAIVWRVDDGDNASAWWTTANAGLPDPFIAGSNATPLDYLVRRGIVTSLSIPSDVIGRANYYTQAALLVMLQAGAEIMCHSRDLTSTLPTTLADMIDQVLTTKLEIEADLATSLPTTYTVPYWDKVKAFVVPGGASGWGATGPFDLWSTRNTQLCHLIEKHYNHLQLNVVNDYGGQGMPQPRWFDYMAASLGTVGNFTRWVDAMLARWSTPGSVNTILHHKVPTSLTVAEWKYMADAIYGLIRRGQVIGLTMSTAKNSLLQPQACRYNTGTITRAAAVNIWSFPHDATPDGNQVYVKFYVGAGNTGGVPYLCSNMAGAADHVLTFADGTTVLIRYEAAAATNGFALRIDEDGTQPDRFVADFSVVSGATSGPNGDVYIASSDPMQFLKVKNVAGVGDPAVYYDDTADTLEANLPGAVAVNVDLCRWSEGQAWFWGGLPTGLLNIAQPIGDLTPFTFYTGSAGTDNKVLANAIDPNTLHAWEQGFFAYLNFNTNVSTGAYINLQHFSRLKPGARYLLRFDLKAPYDDTAVSAITLEHRAFPLLGSTSNGKPTTVSYSVPTTWQTRMMTLFVPAWCQYSKLTWQRQSAADESNKGFQVSNIQLTEI